MAARKLRFALIGTGRIGRVHFKNILLNERASVKYVIEENVEQAKEFLSRYQLEEQVKVLQADGIQEVYSDQE